MYITILSFLLLIIGCITPFIPETDETQELVVVEGLITDQEGINTIKLSKSMDLGYKKTVKKPLHGCTVTITDDIGNSYLLTESDTGTYMTNANTFKGSVGRKYTLHINTNNSTANHYSYQSSPIEMLPVPPIDSVYFERVSFDVNNIGLPVHEGCRIYMNTYDPQSICKFYRWDFVETWEFHLPYNYVKNKVCWTTSNSSVINVKNTSVLSEDRIIRLPITLITAKTDRLNVKYSILVNQYSLNENEYTYWDKLKSISQEVGSLYDVTPASVQGNIYCIEDPAEKVLGYFSVSAKESKRIFIAKTFAGHIDLYKNCIWGTIPYYNDIGAPTIPWWVIAADERADYRVITVLEGCADCSVRGSSIVPDFLKDFK